MQTLFVKAAENPDYYYIRLKIKPRFDSVLETEQNCCLPIPVKVLYVAELQVIPIAAAKRAGEDGWGIYYDMTGNEGPETCFLCGAETKRRYCKGHRASYQINYSWGAASHAALMKRKIGREQYQGRYRKVWHTAFACDECEHRGPSEDFQVHHIIPLCGHNRTYHKLNRQDNLTVLCRDCHKERHKTLREPLKLLQPGWTWEEAEGQLVLNL